MIETYEFSSIEELMEFISPWGESTALDGYIFRGHSQEDFKLIPTALRPECVDYFWKICGGRPIDNQYNWQNWQVRAEYQILRRFYRLADQRGLEVPISNRMRSNLAQEFDFLGLNGLHDRDTWIPHDLLETAALAQHYGIPTRLLDWTYDLYVALYFATRGALKKDGRLVVWALNKERLTFLKPTVNRVDIDFITPHYAGNPNLNAQKGLFTHWSIELPSHFDEVKNITETGATLTDRRPLDEQIQTQMAANETINIFKRLVLPCSEAKKACKILDRLGYDSARIFPGYHGVSEQILNQHRYY